MANSHTTTEMIAALQRKISMPISQATFTNQDIIDFLDDEMRSTIVPIIMDTREEFFIAYEDFTLSDDSNIVQIPTKAIGERLRDVVIIDGSNEEYITNVPRLSLEQIAASGVRGRGSYNYGTYGFLVEANSIKLYPTNGWTGDTIRLYYFRRPGKLVPVGDTGKITAINGSIVSVDNVPATWAVNDEVDVICGSQPFGTVGTELTITNIANLDLTLDDVTGLTIGDYVCEVNQSPIAQVPIEAHDLLVQSAKVQILEALDDERNWKTSVKKYDIMLTNFIKTITPRVDGQPKKIISRNNLFELSRSRGI